MVDGFTAQVARLQEQQSLKELEIERLKSSIQETIPEAATAQDTAAIEASQAAR